MMADLDEFQRSCLDAHNKLRSERGVPELTWSEDVATFSRNWAENVSDRGYLQNSDNSVFGENILLSTDDVGGDQVVLKWLEEESNYNYDWERWQRGTSKFTQMVWKKSREFAIVKVPLKNKDGFVVVANYRPRGNDNKPGEYKRNVPAPDNDSV